MFHQLTALTTLGSQINCLSEVCFLAQTESRYIFSMNLRTAIVLIVALIVVGGAIWEFRGITFYSARIEKKK